LLKWWGVESASASNFKTLLKSGIPIALVPGGYEEATLTTPY
jgi:2-acylglycerol O-acyltransferase 2